MHFSLEKLINYNGNRYELARATMEYAKKVRYLETEDYHKVSEKDALVALKAVLDGNIKFVNDSNFQSDFDEDEFDDETEGASNARY